MRIKFTAGTPGDDVISVSDLKDFLRVSGSDDDTLIGALRDAAISYVEGHCNTHLGEVTGIGYLDSFYNARFPIGPIVAVSSIQYKDISNATQTLDTERYYLDLQSDVARVEWDQPPTLYDHGYNKVLINLTVGHSVDTIPEPIFQAIRILVSHFYDNRHVYAAGRNINEIPFAVTALLNQQRYI